MPRLPTAKRRLATGSPQSEAERWRIACGLLQKEAAHKLGVGLATFRSWEYGIRRVPFAHRVLMRMYAEGLELPEPWPK